MYSMSVATDRREEVFDLEGMTCASCVASVDRAIRSVAGVVDAQVSLPLKTARVTWAPGGEDGAAAGVVSAVGAAGFRATPRAGLADGQDPLHQEAAAAERHLREQSVARRRFLIALAGSLPLIGVAWAGLLGAELPAWTAWLQLVLASAVMVGAASIYAAAARQARHLSANMDTLVALGTLAAYGASVQALLGGGHLHFGPVGMILTLVLLGRFLEARAQGRTGAALRRLLDLAPPIALRLDADHQAHEVPLGEVRPGDLVRVLKGAHVPCDGTVESGTSTISEAMLSGESLPVSRGPGEEVVGGTLNLESPLVVRVSRTGEETRLARIVRLVAQAQGSKASVERLADRVSGVFVPVVLLLAILTGVGWAVLGPGGDVDAALMAAVAVLVVACPCALGLATPTAIVVAVGRAAQEGILIRDAGCLEALRDVTHVVFDKTGTLTTGEFVVTAVEPAGAAEEATILSLAAAVEGQSEHPLARGIVGAQRARSLPALPASDVDVVVGQGVRGSVVGKRVRVGSLRWLAEEGIDLAGRDPGSELAAAVGVARDDVFLGTIRLEDSPRPTAAAAIARLQGAGLTCVLLSGDRREAAQAVAARLGITEVLAEVPPEGKLSEIERLRASGARVAMVGDGLNDAPALAAADVGIAMGQGTDVAKEAAAITLLRDDPLAVADAVLLARETLRTVRQNLGWAFGYNAVTLPLAMVKLLHPVVAAGAMALSSVLVVGNSLRLRRS